MQPSPLMNMGMATPTAIPLSGLASPTQSTASRWSDGSNRDSALPFNRSPSMSDFEIERAPKQSSTQLKRTSNRKSQSNYDNEQVLRTSVSRLIAAKTRPFTISGRIPLDPSSLVLFFRS